MRVARTWITRAGLRLALFTVAFTTLAGISSARAQEQLYFSATDRIMDVLVQRINAEPAGGRIDMSIWLLTERLVTGALANAFHRGVQVRLIGDRGSIFEIDALTRREFYWLAQQGIPIRIRYNPTWYPEINHWKATIFVQQGVVMFGSANYTPFELAPAVPGSNYKDEVVLLTGDTTLVNAFKAQFDRIWNDTTTEPESVQGPGPYLRNWDDACRSESVCNDYWTTYPNRAAMMVDTRRLEGNHFLPPEMGWGQGPSLNNRVVDMINAETTRVDFAAFRLTVPNITDALIAKHRSGVPVRVMIEQTQYLNRVWPEFWLTHAYVDKLWAAGVPVKQRRHDGLMHMKAVATSQTAVIASANFAAGWQRDHNYFIPAAGKPTLHQTMRNRLAAMWNDGNAFEPFVPQPPDAPNLSVPFHGATGVSTTPTFTWDRAPFAVSYNVYLGTSSSSMAPVANVPAVLTNDPPSTYSWTPGTALQGGTTYFWSVESVTNASLTASSATRSFTTIGTSSGGGGGGGGALPTPWQNQDVGFVGLSGSATYSNGTFTVKGAGANVWGTSDGFHYVYQPINGDAEIVARVASIQASSTYAKAGVMLRGSLSASAPHVILDVRPVGWNEFMRRPFAGGETEYLSGTNAPAPTWVKLTRQGSTVTGYVSSNGSTWSAVGTTTLSVGATAYVGLIVSSVNTSELNTSTFTNVTVTTGGTAPPPPPPPPPPTTASNIVIYASDVPGSALRGSWSHASDSTSPNGVKLVSSNNGVAQFDSPLPAPSHFFDVTFNAVAGTPYRIWLRLRALNNDKFNDSLWVQFSDAQVNGSNAYTIGSPSGLMVNLATSANASSLSGWGWQNGAYWLSQPTAVTFPTTGSRTLRVQIREDGVQLDQIVLSPTTYFNSSPGPVSNDSTIVPK